MDSPGSSPPAPEPAAARRRRLTRLGIYLSALLLAWLVIRFVAQPYEVEGSSMVPSLQADDEVLVGKWAARFGSLRPGDIVVVRREQEPDWVLIKRIIAVPGERIGFRDGLRLLSGKPAAEPWLNPRYQDLTGLDPVQLGDNEYFVAGDNRWDSRDSRSFGPVRRSEIVGRVWLRLWPADRMGRILLPAADEPPMPLVVPGPGDKKA
jgi:signal peptidase I